MARISAMVKHEKTRNTVHTQARCTYSVFVDAGTKYFQIDTYGTDQRKVQGQPSQKIQFDREFAAELVEVLKTEFRL